METVVRMGEASASRIAGDTLACIGLGSCIGLALVDRAKGVAALAHVMLPESTQPDPPQPHKFADLAVPALIELALAEGAARIRAGGLPGRRRRDVPVRRQRPGHRAAQRRGP